MSSSTARPAWGCSPLNALTAARDGVLIPVQCEYLALEGLGHLLKTIYMVRDNLNPGLTIAGVVLTMFDARTNLSQQVVDEVRHYFPGLRLPDGHPAHRAPERGAQLRRADPAATPPIRPAPLAYQALAQELMERNEQ